MTELSTRAYVLSGTNLVQFDPANPSAGTTTAITGVAAGETLVGVDFRPANGMLYGLGVNAATGTGTLYAISTRTGVATTVGATGQIAFVDTSGTPINLPASSYGIDFNPVSDRLRVVTDTGLNFRVNPNTGAPVDVDNNAANGINPDGAISGATTTVDATAYTNNQLNSTTTTIYTLSAATNQLFIQNPPNNGTQNLVNTVTLGGNPLDFSSVNGFDIPAGATGSGLASLTVAGVTGLYSIDLATGAATSLGDILNGTTQTNGLSIQTDDGGAPAFAVSEDGNTLLRFDTATPGTVVSVPISSLVAGEKIMAIDFRPQTGQLYALAVNATANTGTVYIVDPQTGALTAVGTLSQILFVDSAGMIVDLPASGYGMDFDPTVDRIRVTTDTGLNFRINPNNGAPVDGDGNPADGINPDTPINGLPPGSTGITATAYTNSFGQVLTGGATTQYTLDAVSNSLFIQSPPNTGTQTTQVQVTLAGSPLDFTSVAGFDIPAEVGVAVSGAQANGFGFAALVVAGTVGLYRIDLTTGVATSLGAIGTGSVQLSGLTVGDAPSIEDAVPTVTINQGAGQSDPVGAGPIVFDVVFSEEVTGFDASDISLAGSTAGGTLVAQVTGSGANYTVSVTGMTSSGTVVASIVAGAALDAASNPSGASTSIDNSVTFNFVNTGPVVSGPVTLAPIAEDSGARLITQAELLTNASDSDGPSLTATGLVIAAGNGTLVDNHDGTWSYTPAANDDTSVSFSYAVTDGTAPAVVATASLDITPVDDVPVLGVTILGSRDDDLVDAAHFVPGQPPPTNEDDFIRGFGGNDRLSGLGGNDVIRGDKGKDIINGGAGDDILNGGSGKNKLIGGPGSDSFIFDTKLGLGNDGKPGTHFSYAKIADFAPGEDVLVLDHAVFKALDLGTLSPSQFHFGGFGGQDGDDHILYKGGALYYDHDGKGGDDAVQFATLAHKPAIGAADILIV